MVAPSLVIITVIAAFISNFMDLAIVNSAFSGIRVCVCVLILDAVMKLAKKALVDRVSVVLSAIILVLSLFTDISPAILVVAAGAAGIVLKRKRGKVK